MMKFEAGVTYSTRSIGDHNCIIRCTIAKRTAKTITTTDGKTFRVGVSYDGRAETFRPWGNYSMAPTMTAECTRPLYADWEKAAAAEANALWNADQYDAERAAFRALHATR